MGKIHAILSDGIVATDVEVCRISYPFHFSCNCMLTVPALFIICFTFISKFPPNINSLSCIYLCVCEQACMCACHLCEYVYTHVIVVQPVEYIRIMGERKHHQ